jgi:hypothetical protein
LANRPRSIFRNELRFMAQDDTLSKIDRATLIKLADDPCIEEVWTKIEQSCGEGVRLWQRFLIRQIVCNRNLAAKVEAWPNYQSGAGMAEDLTNFLSGKGGVHPPLPGQFSSALVHLLEELRKQLQEQARKSLVKISRENVDGSREYHIFMQLMSLTMQELFHRHFDSEVVILTNVLFPRADATTDSVRSVRRLLTKTVPLTNARLSY